MSGEGSSPVFRGTPGHGASHEPSGPRSMKRRRQVRTVSGVIRSRRDTPMLEWTSEHPGTLLERRARA